MSATLTLMQLLSDGKQWTLAQLKLASGLPDEQFDNGMRVLRTYRYASTAPKAYQLTEKGAERIGNAEAIEARKQAKEVRRVARAEDERRRRAAAAAKRVPKKRGRPPLSEEVKAARQLARVAERDERREQRERKTHRARIERSRHALDLAWRPAA